MGNAAPGGPVPFLAQARSAGGDRRHSGNHGVHGVVRDRHAHRHVVAAFVVADFEREGLEQRPQDTLGDFGEVDIDDR